MSDEKKDPTYTVAGEFMGRFVSRSGLPNRAEALQYAGLKGWTNYRVIRG